jgi:hypothetical protein
MPAAQPSKDLRMLCYDHLLEMGVNRSFVNSAGDGTQATTHGCTEADCLVHYNTSRGYFTLKQNGNKDEMDMAPKLRCFLDGAPMYLAEISPAKRDYRLWTCPQCGASRTNEEGLIGLASPKAQDLGTKNAAQSGPA